MKEKMTEQMLIRLTPTLLDRLDKVCRERGLDKTEMARGAILQELARLESEVPPAAREQLSKLQEAGLPLDEVVADAIARKFAEEAQMTMPLAVAAGGGR